MVNPGRIPNFLPLISLNCSTGATIFLSTVLFLESITDILAPVPEFFLSHVLFLLVITNFSPSGENFAQKKYKNTGQVLRILLRIVKQI
uniref:ORF88 n=1 Tax=Saccharolobus islandicus TaxID=43080 RepID=Q9C4W1_SACIS|nr:hypothetical protein [Sulfolobus islandicus]AAK06931.1 ORF88 [Sulfolobus islandicus]